jgi:hypothetical protein
MAKAKVTLWTVLLFFLVLYGAPSFSEEGTTGNNQPAQELSRKSNLSKLRASQRIFGDNIPCWLQVDFVYLAYASLRRYDLEHRNEAREAERNPFEKQYSEVKVARNYLLGCMKRQGYSQKQSLTVMRHILTQVQKNDGLGINLF